MPVSLINSMATTEPLAELFSDSSVLRSMLDFEIALARVESKLKIIPRSAADAIATAADPAHFDIAELSRKSLRAGTPSIPLVTMLRDLVRVRDPHAADFVHWGATSQDVSDTAMVLLLKRAQPLIDADLVRAEQGLHRLSDGHRSTVMTGRTLLQAAPPVTFGLKAATWFAALHRCRERLTAAFADALFLQFGGAAGTLAALGKNGSRAMRELADELKLGCPDAPWHTQRDRLATLVCACGVVTGSLGKVARDISLLMQTEVGEAAEPPSEGRGGSSTMPHKKNPIGCALTLAAAARVPALVSSYLSAMVQEHERAAGGSQSEWPVIAEIVQATGVAAASIAEIAACLQVDAARMRKNLDATLGTIYAEKAMMLLIPKLGRDKAHQLVEQALQQAISQNLPFADALAELSEVRKHFDLATLQQLSVPEDYLGSAELFRKQQLQASTAVDKED